MMDDAQIRQMVDRFLSWRLPENFAPDGGVTLTPHFDPAHARGTNLLDAAQAEIMVRHLVEGIPSQDDAIAAAVAKAKLDDRTALFIEIDELTNKICQALEEAPYKIAAPAMRHIDAITAAVSDPLGDHFGACFLCEEPIFVRGQPDDDCEAAGDEYVHRTCGDRWRTEHPGEHTRNDDGGGE